MTHAKRLYIHCDVVHPESGEVLAEPDDVFVLPHPVAEHILDVAKAHPTHYDTVLDGLGSTHITPTTLATRRGYHVYVGCEEVR